MTTRRDFLKLFGVGVAVAATPTAFVAASKAVEIPVTATLTSPVLKYSSTVRMDLGYCVQHYWTGSICGRDYAFSALTETETASPEIWEMAYAAFQRRMSLPQ